MAPKNPCKKIKTHHNDDVKAVTDQSINILDYDSLAAIFMYLPFKERLEIENVCEKWSTACERAWSDIKSFNSEDTEFINKHFKESEQYQDQVETLLHRCGIYIKELSLNRNYDSEIIPVIKENCHNLLKLELEITDDNDESFEDVFSNMKNLESIKIIHRNADDDFSNEYRNVLESLPETIENIYYDCGDDDCPHISEDFALTVIKFNKLNCLVLRNWRLDEVLIDTLCQKNSITQLNLEYSQLNQSRLPISKLTNLVALNVADMNENGLCDDDMIEIIENCDKIESLNLRRCKRLTLVSLNKLYRLKNLEKLVLDHTDAKDSVFGIFPNLQRLECVNCNLTDAGIIRVLKNSPRLENLDICWTDMTIETIKYASSISKSRGRKLSLYIDKLFSLKNSELIDKYRSELLYIDDDATEICLQFFCVLFRYLEGRINEYDGVNSSNDDDEDEDENEEENEDEDEDDDDDDDDNNNDDEDEDEDEDDEAVDYKNARDSNDELNYDGDEDDNESDEDL